MACDTAHTSASLVDRLQAYDGIIIVVAFSFLVGVMFGSLTDGLAYGIAPSDTAPIGVIGSAGQPVGFGVVGAGYLSTRDDRELIRFERPTTHDVL